VKAALKPQAWLDSGYGQRFLELESEFTRRALRQISGPTVLQLGRLIHDEAVINLDLPQLVRAGRSIHVDQTYFDLSADAAFLPFADCSFASAILPHVLEGHTLPHQVLREAHRVLMPEGQLLLTCFNPYSVIGLQRFIRPNTTINGPYYGFIRVKDWLNLLGFEINASAAYHYAPLCRGEYLTRKLKFINYVGDRWMPMLGGSFLLVARKKEMGVRLVGREQVFSSKNKHRGLAPAGANKSTLEKDNTTQRSQFG
jgi:SAM-dependent methyltransferase